MRLIVFLHLQQFYVSAARSLNLLPPEASAAVFRRDLVLDMSREARDSDVVPGISRKLARKRCPDLHCLEEDPDVSASLYNRVWNIFASRTPQVEPTDFHKGYLDLTGCIPRISSLAEVMEDARLQLRFDFGVESCWGGGQDKWIAHLARGENRFVLPEEEASFLEHVAVKRLGFSDDFRERLQRFGITTVSEILSVPSSFFQSHLQLAAGELQPYLERLKGDVKALFPPPDISATADLLWGDNAELSEALRVLAETAAAELREKHMQAGRLSFICGTQTLEHKFAKPLHDRATLEDLLRRFIIEQHLMPPPLHKEAKEHKSDPPLFTRGQGGAKRRLRIELSALTPYAEEQTELWRDRVHGASDKADRITKARQHLDRKFGYQTIQSGSDYSRRYPPRFAQLIFERRGIYIP
jgi:hypothetical protein